MRRLLLLLVLLSPGCGAGEPPTDGRTGPPAPYDPAAVFLTWRSDPTTTMVVDWHTLDGETFTGSLQYRSRQDRSWRDAPEAVEIRFPFSDRLIHRVELEDLAPDTEYRFRFAVDGREYRFRTLPTTLGRPVRFLVGGDMMQEREWMERTARVGMTHDPDFVLVGGDLAYGNGRAGRVGRWYDYFEAYREALITDEGRLVPVIHAPGNHEVRTGYWFRDRGYAPTASSRAANAPYFLTLFAFPGQPGYGVLDVGDYLSIIVLDSDHIGPVDGRQAEWLSSVLARRADRPHVLPIYHVPAYPSVRRLGDRVNTRIREHWVPLFEAHGLGVVFEAHDHAYKRTHPIRGGRIEPSGVTYVGDGAWGAHTRRIGSRQPRGEGWYLKRGASRRHVILGTITGGTQRFRVLDEDGELLDEFETSR